MSLYRPLEAEPGMLRFKLFHLGRPVTMSDSLPMLERMGLRVIDERPHRVSPPGEPPVWLHDFGMQTAADTDVDVHALHSVFEDAFGRVFRGEVENDDFNRLVRRGAHARHGDRRAARVREVHAPDRLPAVAGVRRVDARRASRHRADAGRALQAALRSDAGGARAVAGDRQDPADRRRARPRRQPVGRPRAPAVPDADPRHDAHELLAHRRRRAPPGLPVVQVRSVEGAGTARAPADVRDLRLFAALRGSPPARRQGRARRPALVGPARGFPHRDPRARQGPDGEEHRHRPRRARRAASC